MQGVIAEYERAKIAERYRRGKLYRARQGEIPFWKTSYAHRRVVPADGGPARIEIFEPEAEIVREIFDAYVEKGRSVRQIALDLLERGIAVADRQADLGHLYDHAAAATTRRISAPSTTTAANRWTATARAARATARPATANAHARSGSRSPSRRSSTVTRSIVSSRSSMTTRSGTRAARSGAHGCCAA